MVLGALLCIAFGASRFLARYHLVVDGHSKVVAGASYADVNFWLPGYDLIVACWFAAALILGVAAASPRIRNWLLMRQSHWLAPLAALAVLFVGAYAVPTSIEDFYVGPNQITLELPYLLRSIAGTRQAYNLQGPSVEEREFAVSATPLTAADLTKECRDAAGRAHLGLARARAATAANPGLAALLHVSRRRYRSLCDRWRRAAGHDHGAGARCYAASGPGPGLGQSRPQIHPRLRRRRGSSERDRRQGQSSSLGARYSSRGQERPVGDPRRRFISANSPMTVSMCTPPRRNSISRKAKPTPRPCTRELAESCSPTCGASWSLPANSTVRGFSSRDISRLRAG